MLQDIKNFLANFRRTKDRPPPVVPIDLYFEGNSDEECIAPNQFGEGRPNISEMYAIFKSISARSNVHHVLVGLHDDWDDTTFPDQWPPAESIHIYTTASPQDVERWITNLKSDGLSTGWPYGIPENAPPQEHGVAVYTVFWD